MTTERWHMSRTRLEALNTSNSVFIGLDASANEDLCDNDKVAVGNNALYFYCLLGIKVVG